MVDSGKRSNFALAFGNGGSPSGPKGNNAKVRKKVQKKMTENFASSKFCCNFAELFRHKPEARKNIERFTIDEVVQELNKLSVDSETIQV